MPETHASLGASSASRWLACPGSMGLCKGKPNKSSVYAREGTLAHSIVELRSIKRYAGMGPKIYEEKLAALQADKLYDPEMMACSDAHLELIDTIIEQHAEKPVVRFEQTLKYDNYVPDGWGTGDTLVMSKKRVDVADYKHGKGVHVEVKNNPQLMLYGLGALQALTGPGMPYNIDTVGLHICQPRNGGVSSWIISAADLRAWGEAYVKPKAQVAYECYSKGPAGVTQDQLCPGDHCRFCLVNAECKARAQAAAVEAFGKKEPLLYSDAELAEILKRGREYTAWINDVQAHCLQRSLAGDNVPGWKAVEGRGSRQFKNADTAFSLLSMAGYPKDLFYERKPLTVAQAEKVVGKKEFSRIMGELVESKPGKPTLAPVEDKRIAITSAELAFSGVEIPD